MDPKDIVRSGYNKASVAYRSDDAMNEDYADWLRDLAGRLHEGASILDLGCGCGLPAARWLSDRGVRVLGIDISPVILILILMFITNVVLLGWILPAVAPPPSF